MQSENMGLVIVLVLAILIGSNLLMLGMVRGSRGGFFGNSRSGDALSNPWKKQNDEFGELSRRVRALKSDEDEQP
ncbi:MAG: hypothetical protein OHK0031_14080 [Anaerolineales bacterium]